MNDSWLGYAYDVPAGPRPEQGRHAAELDLRRLLYARVLSQLGRKSATGEGERVDVLLTLLEALGGEPA